MRTFRLFWSGLLAPLSLLLLSPRTVAQTASQTASQPASQATARVAPPNGLTAAFFRDRQFTRLLTTRVDPTIDFNWDNRAPGFGLPATNYAVRWTGYLQPPLTGTYTFVISTDDGMRVWLDDKSILDVWREQVPTDYRVRVPLTAGQPVALRVEYFQEQYQARARVRWLLPDADPTPDLPGLQAPEPQQISPRYLFTRNPAAVVVAPPVVPPPPVVVALPADTIAGLPTLQRGVQFDLPNVYFETGKARLLPRSAQTLNRLAEALLAQPALQLEISGHTDIIGDSAANRQLSEARAERVLEYLTMRGVAPARLTAVGYGATRPVAKNDSPAERARNRRVEVRVR